MLEIKCGCGHVVKFELTSQSNHLSAEELKRLGEYCICAGCYIRMTGQSVEVAPKFEGKKPKMLLVENLPNKLLWN